MFPESVIGTLDRKIGSSPEEDIVAFRRRVDQFTERKRKTAVATTRTTSSLLQRRLQESFKIYDQILAYERVYFVYGSRSERYRSTDSSSPV